MPLAYHNDSATKPSTADYSKDLPAPQLIPRQLPNSPPPIPSLDPFPITPPPRPSLPPVLTDHSQVCRINDRAELIEKIKAGEAPTWSPTRPVADRYYPNHAPSATPRLVDEHPDRPKSALHQGVFTSESRNSQNLPHSPTFPPSSPFPFGTRPHGLDGPLNSQSHFPSNSERHVRPVHTRAPSISGSFVLKTPTSPLVHSSNPDADENEDSRFGLNIDPIDINSTFAERQARRRSLPPTVLSSLQFSPSTPSLHRQQTFSPATLTRRPVSELWHESPSPSPSSRANRRLSAFGASSDLPPGSFLGSYEESILNGRMSTAPSKPLNFLAQIGVLGLGKCKQSLRCPAHVTLPFPAYFYSVGDYDSPSPYVGQIDLDAALGSESSKSVKKSPPGVGGSYRIPQRGQLQIVIKNPNKTAVKLFLVPYDLRDMEAGTKTFIRQKSYSVGGSALDLPMNASNREKEKDSLRYLIHLHIVCPSRGRYYLFRSIRVVFANRVPDGKERLRNEILWAEPKYSHWKPEPKTTTPSSSFILRKRSTSLYGVMPAPGVSGRRPKSPPPPPLPFNATAFTTNRGTDADNASDASSEYEKMDISNSLQKNEGQGLLARRLKELEVEATDSGRLQDDLDLSP